MRQRFELSVNGASREVECDPERTLLDCLREDLRLTGTKRGCDIGVCGTCTVLVDGKAQRACKVKVKDVARGQLAAPQILTIEGLEGDGKLHPIQQAFVDCGAIQCGFCTPGMVMQALALLTENPRPTRDQIKKALAANLCRCTGYQQIFEAVEEAARRMQP
jgi:aerobic carbon-monoxide dehydrogenase small subunit